MVDPTKLNQELNKKNTKSEHTYLRAFVFSFIGALVGAALSILIHYFFVHNDTISTYAIILPLMVAKLLQIFHI